MKKVALFLSPVFLVTMPAITHACAVCFGDPNSPMTRGLKMGIIVLLGCIGAVLASFAGLFCYWAQRTRRLALSSHGVTNP